MAVPVRSPGKALLAAWKRCQGLPLGATLFSVAFGRKVPYSGSIGARIRRLEPGHAFVELPDRRKVRNHLDSIHAVALMNLAELSTGLALNTGLPDDARSILTRLSIDYLKKARGTLTSECRVEAPRTNEKRDVEISATIRNADGDVVAHATAFWRVGPEL